MPVHSESRQPRTSSSSARPSSACSLTGLLQAGLDRVTVHAAVLEVEFVGPVLDVADRVARDEGELDPGARAPGRYKLSWDGVDAPEGRYHWNVTATDDLGQASTDDHVFTLD